MATYTIVASTTDPLGSGEIAAGSTIQVSEGDVYIVDSTADLNVNFAADGGIPANFEVVINDSNVNTFTLKFEADLTPTMTVADNVDASNITIDAKSTDAMNLTAGNNAQLGALDGSVTGVDTISIGNGFTATGAWKTAGGDDDITIDDNATFTSIETGDGADNLTVGDAANITTVNTGAGNDTVSFGDDLVVGSVKTDLGDDIINLGANTTVSMDIDGGSGTDTLNTQSATVATKGIETTNVPSYISEVAYEGGASSNFIEIVVPHGTDTSLYSIVIYDTDGTVQSIMSLGSLDVTHGGNDGYVLDETDAGFVDIHDNDGIALVDDTGTVLQFLGFKTAITAIEGPADGQTTAITGDISSGGHSVQTADGGKTYTDTYPPNPGTIPCYAPGTLIDTPDGPRAVEDLKIGDLVTTLDHGPQAIRWVHSGDHPLEEADVDAKPVLIAAGALGKGLPTQDLTVSPQHRMFVGGGGQLDDWFKTESFAPAKSLTALHGIRHMKGKKNISWIHFACDKHEVVTANGCLSECLLLGPMVVNGLSVVERRTLTDIFGAASTPEAALNGPPARECLKVGEVKRHLAQCMKEQEHLTAKETRKWDVDLAMEQYEAGRLRQTKTDGDQTFAPGTVSGTLLTRIKLAALKDCSEAVQHTDYALTTCERIIEILHGKLKYQRSAIILKRQSDGRPLLFSHCRGALSDTDFTKEVVRLNRLIETKTTGVVHSVLDYTKPIIVGDVGKHSGYVSADDDMKSEACFPLVFNGKCIGAFNVESDQKNAFDDDDAAIMTTISTQLALVINQARRQHATGITDHLERLSA